MAETTENVEKIDKAVYCQCTPTTSLTSTPCEDFPEDFAWDDINYKEYAFVPPSDSETDDETKIESFWKFVKQYNINLPPVERFPEIEGETPDEPSVQLKLKKSKSRQELTWCEKLRFLRQKGFEKLAYKARIKHCGICSDTEFQPVFADESCKGLVYEITMPPVPCPCENLPEEFCIDYKLLNKPKIEH